MLTDEALAACGIKREVASPRDLLIAGIREDILAIKPVSELHAERLADETWERAELAAERKGLEIHLVPKADHVPLADSNAVAGLLNDVLAELQRARAKFPKSDGAALAWVEEVGEAAVELLTSTRPELKRAELVQVMAMCARLILEPCPLLPGTEQAHVKLLMRVSDAGSDAHALLESLT